MRTFLVATALTIGTLLGTPAHAAYAPVAPAPKPTAIALDTLGLGNAGHANDRERAYFSAPLPAAGGGLSCRAPSSLFDKTRLALACR